MLIILLLLLTVTSYILGLYKWGSVVQFFALLAAEFVVGNVFASLGLCIGAFVRNPSYLMTVTMICLVWVFAFSGFFVPVDQMDPGLSWMVYINPATYSFALYFQIILKVGRAPSFFCAELSQYASCDEPGSNGMISPDEVVAEYDLDRYENPLCHKYILCFNPNFFRISLLLSFPNLVAQSEFASQSSLACMWAASASATSVFWTRSKLG